MTAFLRNDSAKAFPFVLWESPDRTIRQVNYDSLDDLMRALTVFDRDAHLLVGAAITTENIDGFNQDCMMTLAHERGTSVMFVALQPLNSTTWRPAGKIRYDIQQSTLKAPKLENGAAPEALVPALRDGVSGATPAFEALKNHGAAAHEALAAAAKSDCLLMQTSARIALDALGADADPKQRPDLALTIPVLQQQHPDTDVSWLTSFGSERGA